MVTRPDWEGMKSKLRAYLYIFYEKSWLSWLLLQVAAALDSKFWVRHRDGRRWLNSVWTRFPIRKDERPRNLIKNLSEVPCHSENLIINFLKQQTFVRRIRESIFVPNAEHNTQWHRSTCTCIQRPRAPLWKQWSIQLVLYIYMYSFWTSSIHVRVSIHAMFSWEMAHVWEISTTDISS